MVNSLNDKQQNKAEKRDRKGKNSSYNDEGNKREARKTKTDRFSTRIPRDSAVANN
jgi:hypothetical protein